MTHEPLHRRLLAEALGTTLLLATVVGSGIMSSRLAGENIGLALLCNAVATAAILVVAITTLGPVSGAHLNPAVSLAMAMERRIGWTSLTPYVAAQFTGAILGLVVAHAMFDMPLLQLSTTARTGFGQWLGEAIATYGLVLTILGCLARAPRSTPTAVGLYILAAYWFTSSTSFANPAVTVARMLTNSFAGIAPADGPAFIVSQIVGMLAAIATGKVLWPVAGPVSGAPAAPLPPAGCGCAPGGSCRAS